MSALRKIGALVAVLAVVACSSSSSGDGEGASNGGTGGTPGGGSTDGGSTPASDGGTSKDDPPKLACNAYAWCTTWDASSKAVANPPALDGGTLADGMYRLAEGTFGAEAYVIQGGAILHVGSLYSNQLGTVTTSGSDLTITYTTSCTSEGDKPSSGSTKYRYKATATDLFLAYVDTKGNVSAPHRFQKIDPTAICKEDSFFRCHVTNCACSASFGKGLPKPTGNPTAQCG